MLALLLALQAAAAPAAPDVVIYGKRLDAAHKACVAGQCSVLRDVQVSIALAEQQFRAGAYLRARKTLGAALGRQRDHAATDPKPVAALYEAYATVSLHEGDLDIYRRAVRGQVQTLRENLPPGDPAVAAVRFATADMWIELNRPRSADAAYAAAEQRARAAGDVRGATLAALRRVGLAAAMRDTGRARRMLAAIEADPAAADATLQSVMRVVALRIAARSDDAAAVDRLVTDIGHAAGTRPALIWQPDYRLSSEAAARQDARTFGDPDPRNTTSGDVATIQWVDIGYWIRPDGRTAEAEILRGSNGTGAIRWLLDQVAGRRYTGSGEADAPGIYRIERFTWRPIYITPTGSNIRRRAGPPSVETLDLTDPSATPVASR